MPVKRLYILRTTFQNESFCRAQDLLPRETFRQMSYSIAHSEASGQTEGQITAIR